MNKIIITVLAFALLVACSNQKTNSSFELKGTLTNTNHETVYLEKLSSTGTQIVDSSVIDEKGNFNFSNYTPTIGFYRLKADDRNFAMLILDSTQKVTLTGDYKNLGNTYKIEGSKETQLFLEYNDLAKENKRQVDSLQQVFQTVMQSTKMDSLRMDSLSKTFEKPYQAIMDKANEAIAKKINQNLSSFASLMSIQQLDPEKYIDVYKQLADGLTKAYPNNADIKSFQEYISKRNVIAIGSVAPEISLPTPEGTIFKLSSLKGKIVLIDFWASWCGPCRKDMPNVKKLYEKYKNKGFEILGVSLDKEKESWLAAIQKDGLTWPQVSDLKFWQSEAAQTYAVQAIPYTVLLDRDGNILAKELRGKALEDKLAEILK